MKLIVGVIVSVAAFVLVMLIFGAVGWPTSVLTLGVMLGVAWLVGAAAGGRIAVSKWPAIIATILAVGLATSTIGFGVPWRLGGASVGTGENVWFRMEASFTYRGSEDNLPLENLAIRFPCPNVENVALPTYTIWSLYYQDNENVLHLQANQDQVYGFVGERTETLGIMLSGVEPTTHGPKLYYNLDKLYPQEVFWITTITYATKENADKVTLVEFGENQRTDAYYHSPAEWELPIDLSFWSQLSKKTNDNYEVVETFSRVLDNVPYAWIWLYPPS